MRNSSVPRSDGLESQELLLELREQGKSTAAQPFFENQLLSYKETARYLKISEPYLRRLKTQGKIPFVQVSRRGVRFKLSSLDKWVEEREIK
jgi:excisionase family DNA binding protein